MQKLRIGVDAFVLTKPRTGTGNYLFYYLEELLSLFPEYDFYLYAPVRSNDLDYFIRFPNVIIRTSSLLKRRHIIWEQTALAYLLFHDSIDVFWGASQMAPLFKRSKMKVLFTLHDFFYRLHPETMPALRWGLLKILTPLMLKRADRIFTNSYGTSEKLKRFFNLEHQDVVEPPIKPWLRPIEPTVLESWLQKKDLAPKQYLLAVGTLEPRKNFASILEAFAISLKTYDPSQVLPLVIMGNLGWQHSHLTAMISELKSKYPKSLIFTGYVSEEEQWHYLAGARYLLMLSYYEGYGMPIAEARVCGTEVICTDIPEMREAALEQGIFLSKEEIREKLPLFFLRDSQFTKTHPGPQSYATNREKAVRIASMIESMK